MPVLQRQPARLSRSLLPSVQTSRWGRRNTSWSSYREQEGECSLTHGQHPGSPLRDNPRRALCGVLPALRGADCRIQQYGPLLHPLAALAGKSLGRDQGLSRPQRYDDEVFLPDLENHELMFSLSRRFEDGPLTPTLVIDAYRYCYRLAANTGSRGESGSSAAIPPIRSTSSTAARSSHSTPIPQPKKDIPAFEVSTEGLLGRFLATDIEDLKRECRKRTPSRAGKRDTQRHRAPD